MILIIPLSLLIGFLTYWFRPRSTDAKTARLGGLVVFMLSAVLALLSVIFQIIHNAAGVISVAEISNTLFIAGFIGVGMGILIVVGLLIAGKREVARNIGFGLCLSFFILVIELGLLEWLGGV